MNDNLQDIDITELLIFPKELDDVENLLFATSELLEHNQDYELFMSIKCIFQTNFVGFNEKQNTITYYFVELAPNILLLIPFTKYIINRDSPINYKFEYFEENDLNLYLRDFHVYNSFGDCINNSYIEKNKIQNLFLRYADNDIFLILKSILNGKLLNNVELNLKNSKEILNNSIIFNIFVMNLQKMQNINFGFTKMKKKYDIDFYSNYIIEKFNKNIDIYYNQIKNIRNKIYFYYYNENLENQSITSLSSRNKDDTDIVISENINLSTTSSNFEFSTYNEDDKYIKNLKDENLDFFEGKKKNNNNWLQNYRNDTIHNFLVKNEKIIFETNENENDDLFKLG